MNNKNVYFYLLSISLILFNYINLISIFIRINNILKFIYVLYRIILYFHFTIMNLLVSYFILFNALDKILWVTGLLICPDAPTSFD